MKFPKFKRLLWIVLAVITFWCTRVEAVEYFYFNTGAFYAYEGSTFTGTLYRSGGSAAETVYILVITNTAGTGVPPINVPSDTSGLTFIGSGYYQLPVTFASGTSSANFSVPLIQNSLVQPDRGFVFSMAPPWGNAGPDGTIQQAWLVLQDNDGPVIPGVQMSQVVEGDVNYFLFDRSTNNTLGSMTVNFTLEGTATKDTDYRISSPFPLTAGSTYQLTIPSGYAEAWVEVDTLQDAVVDDNETVTVRIQPNSAQYTVPNPATATMTIRDDTPTVSAFIINPSSTEGGSQIGFVVQRSIYWTGGSSKTINVSIGGTATAPGDYTPGLPLTVTIPANQYSVTNWITPLTDTNVEGVETVSLTVQSGTNYVVDTPNQTATAYIYDDYPVISVEATDNQASETGGDTGEFTITRQGNLSQAVTVQLSITGTAAPGADYAALPTSVTFPPWVGYTNLVVTALANDGIESAETVVVNLKTNALYLLGLHTNAVVTIVGDGANPRDTYPKGLQYVRGSGTNMDAYSIVVSLAGLTGTRRADVDPVYHYGTFYHYNATNTASQYYSTNRIMFNTPIASFGSLWGSPLYLGQSYSMGVFFGFNQGDPLVIYAYRRSDGGLAGTVTLDAPVFDDANDWNNFATNGFSRSTNAFGLTTTLHAPDDMALAGAHGGIILTHTASDLATNYVFLIGAAGTYSDGHTTQYMVLTSDNAPAYGYFYDLTFDIRPAWRSVFIDQPHFQEEPLPSDLWNKTPEELLNFGANVTNAVALSPSACTNLDQSPELRRHPILDQFVADMNNDPMALANYVQNEIDLTDPLAYRDDGSVATESVNEGGVDRGALGVYLEGQGSPVEQCALLVYLLRQAGYPATYVFPPEGGLKLLDTRLSALLRMRINGAQDIQGRYYTTNQLITVNYPWVAAYVGGQWIHLFPWIKDTSVEEGLDICDYLPDPYKSTQLWVKDYILGKTNIMAFATPKDDTPFTIFPRFLDNALKQNAPGISVDDIGMRYVNRRHLYAQWSDFPRPTWVTNQSTAVESLSSSGIVSVSPALTNLFDTLQVELYSESNPQRSLQTPALRVADLHNRKFFLTHTNLANGQIQTVLTLGPYRPNATGQGSFSAADTTLTNKQVLTLTLDQTDDHLRLRLRHRRQRALSWETALDPDRGFLDLLGMREVVIERPLRKGDAGAICIDTGRVTPAMLRVHAQELWNMEQQLSTNGAAASSVSLDVYQGSQLYLMGMNYYGRCSRSDALLRQLFKVQDLSKFKMGLAKISPRRNPDGTLYNGTVDPIWPNVDMFFQEVMTAGNGTVRLDSGWDRETATRNFFNLRITDGSAQEHAILNAFYGQSNAVSTVKLLQLAQAKAASGGSNVVEATIYNILDAGTVLYSGIPLSSHDPDMWSQILELFVQPSVGYSVAWITPGKQTTPSGSFSGMAALVVGGNRTAGLIGQNQYGAYGDRFGYGTISAGNTANWSLTQSGDDFSITFASLPSDSRKEVWSLWDALQVASQYGNGTLSANPFQNLQGTVNGLEVNGVAGSYGGSLTFTTDLAPMGTPDFRQGNGDWQKVWDPVNALTGEFYIDEVDLSLPGPMPLQVRRNYGSHNLANNQLGYGWKLNYMPFLTVAQTNSVIYEAESDGSLLAFGIIGTNLWAPTLALNPTLNNDSANGIGSVANRLNARLTMQVVNYTNTWYLTNADCSLRIFQEMSFPLTNSPSYDRLRPYLTAWYDNRGNSYRFEYGTDATQADYGQVRRIVGSNGNILRFLYDVYGRVVDVYSLDGRHVQYEYDEHGDLVTVTLPDTSQHIYEYQLLNWTNSGIASVYSTHLLLREDKPDGRVVQNDYDDQRRVTNQWATVGPDLRLVRSASFRYTNNFNLTNLTATLTGTTTILDYTNNPTTYFYTNGLIRRVRDPLGAEVLQAWYESNETNAPAYPRSLRTVTDKRGLVTSYFYDNRGNVTNTTVQGDLRGDGDPSATAIATATYNANNLPLMQVNASGTTNLFFYTNNWLLSRLEVWPSGATADQAIVSLYAYTNVSNVADGTAAYGLRWQEVRAAGTPDAATSETTFSSHGFPTQVVRYTGTADPAVVVTNLYNLRGELAVQTDADGRSVTFSYDPLGRPQAKEVFESGRSVPMAWDYSYYNENGELVWSDGPRYNPEDYVWRDYDAAGRKSQEIHWRSQGRTDGSGVEAATDDLYATTFYAFDLLGNLTRITDPLGNYSLKSYNANGWLLREEFYDSAGVLLATNGFAYNLAGDVTNAFNALGGSTQKQYTSTGKPKYQKNADGSTSSWLYYADGRLWREIKENAAYWETTYNDANRTTTRIFYSSAAVPLATNVIVLDRRGNVVQTIDAAFNVFTNAYDGLDRLKLSAGPATVTVTEDCGSGGMPGCGNYVTNVSQEITTYMYGASSKTLTVANVLGEKTVTTRDALGRVVSVQTYAPGSLTPLRVTTTAYTADHHGLTVTEGTGAEAVSTTTWTDNDGHIVITSRSPSSGKLEYTLSVFDRNGNRIESDRASASGGSPGMWSFSLWSYDGLNRLKTETSRDWAVTTYNRDALGNVTNRVMPGGGLQWNATYNNAGQMLQEFTSAGSAGTRTNSYTYRPAGDNWAGLLYSKTDGLGRTCTYSYDDWLRPSLMSYSGTGLWEHLTEQRFYDARGLLTSISEYYDDAAPVSVQRTYNEYGRLASESVTVPAPNGFAYSAGQSWNAAGRRTGLGIGSAGYNFGWRADGLLGSVSGPAGLATYTYTDGGLLSSRVCGSVGTTIDQRDGEGRPLHITPASGTIYLYDESLTWTDDGLLATHSIGTYPSDNEVFTYAPLSRRLVQEELLANGLSIGHEVYWTNHFGYDNGAAAGLGVLTSAGAQNSSAAKWSGSADAFSRINSETNNTIRRAAFGRVNGPCTIEGWLDQDIPVGVTVAGTNGGQWNATLDLTPGAHNLFVRATHPSGMYESTASVWFTNSATMERKSDVYDAAGFLTQRVWVSASGQTNRTQNLTWDIKGRLWKVSERDSGTNGYDWTAIYDPFGRRLQTSTVLVTNSVYLSSQALFINSYYDPQVEFLELGISQGTKATWKLYGPDLNGVYGGMQGVGGLEAVKVDRDAPMLFFKDARGNIRYHWKVGDMYLWPTGSRPTGYGAVPGYEPPALLPGTEFGDAAAWRGKWKDITGLYWFGARYYNPESGSFLSSDPLWNAQDPNYYSFCGGDPINSFDPDGRCLTAVGRASAHGLDSVWNFGLAFAFTPTSDMTPEQAQAIAQLGIEKSGLGSPFKRWFGVNYEANGFLDNAPAALGPVAQNAVNSFGVGELTATRPSYAGSSRQTQWGAPVNDSYITPENATWANAAPASPPQGQLMLPAPQQPLLLTAGTLESQVGAVYQDYYNQGWQRAVQRFNQGEISVPAGMSWETVLGQQVDQYARGKLLNYLEEQGITEGRPGGDVLVNRRLYDPSGSGAYRIPDVYIPGANVIFDGTIGTKTPATPQIQDFMNWGNNRVNIVSPTVLPSFKQ